MTLKVYDNGCDHVVAESIDDAWRVWCETTGESRDDYGDMEWGAESDGEPLTIRYEDGDYADLYSERPEGATVETKGLLELITATFGAWAKLVGRGWLCSSEY